MAREINLSHPMASAAVYSKEVVILTFNYC